MSGTAPDPRAAGGSARAAGGSARAAGGSARAAGGTVSPWRGTAPELLIAAVLVLVLAVAGYLMAGWAGLAVVAVGTAATAMAVLRVLLPQATPDQARKAREKATARMLSGYSHRRFMVRTATTSLGFYQGELRPVLEHLLAARLAERHGVNLYQDPGKARELLCRGPRDADLWSWIDPATRPEISARWRRRAAGHPGTHPGAPHRPIGEALTAPQRLSGGTTPPAGTTEQTAQACTAILDELERAVVGRRRTLELVLIGILAGGHVLLEDLPGLGKTLIARSFARVLGLDFARIQFTPDLLPSDVVGAPLYDQRSAEMVFRPGPVFTQLLLADEINRTPPKTQAALLEAMGEGQVSVDGHTRRLPEPFIVLATDNPIEYEGTYELPEAQLDRFLMRLRLGYLTTGDETAMLRRRVDRATEYVELNPVASPAGVLAMRESLEHVEVTPDLLDYIVAIVTATRNDAQVQIGASPRGGLALVQLARGQALLSNRDYVIPDDIKQVAVPALAHRVTLRPELWVRQVSSDEVMAKLLAAVPTPRTDPARAVTG